jgi:hypothetical protein
MSKYGFLQLNEDVVDLICGFNADGLPTSEIIKRVNCDFETVELVLMTKGLPRIREPPGELIVVNGKAFCVFCQTMKPVNFFRRGKERRCNGCSKRLDTVRKNIDTDSILGWRWRQLQHNRKRRGNNGAFELTAAQYVAKYRKQKGLCFYSDVPMNIMFISGYNPYTISVDRILPDEGYTDANTVLCCLRVNRMKSDMPLGELEVFAAEWYQRAVKRLRKVRP